MTGKKNDRWIFEKPKSRRTGRDGRTDARGFSPIFRNEKNALFSGKKNV